MLSRKIAIGDYRFGAWQAYLTAMSVAGKHQGGTKF
jgi:hypothetical protein